MILPHKIKPLLKRLFVSLPESMQAGLRRRHYGRKLSQAKLTDEPDLAVISLLTKEGDTVFDLGANFGLFTRFLSESVGGQGKVYSFEPSDDMYEVLTSNCEKLNLANSRVFKTALSDRSGTTEMVIPIREDGTLNHYEGSISGEAKSADVPVKHISVETSTLDDFCSHHSIAKIDFIKCDVEGHEIEVLKGARKTLLHHQPSMLLEVNEPLDVPGHGAKVLNLVRDLGYDVYTCREGEISPWKPGETCVNYVLIHRRLREATA